MAKPNQPNEELNTTTIQKPKSKELRQCEARPANKAIFHYYVDKAGLTKDPWTTGFTAPDQSAMPAWGTTEFSEFIARTHSDNTAFLTLIDQEMHLSAVRSQNSEQRDRDRLYCIWPQIAHDMGYKVYNPGLIKHKHDPPINFSQYTGETIVFHHIPALAICREQPLLPSYKYPIGDHLAEQEEEYKRHRASEDAQAEAEKIDEEKAAATPAQPPSTPSEKNTPRNTSTGGSATKPSGGSTSKNRSTRRKK